MLILKRRIHNLNLIMLAVSMFIFLFISILALVIIIIICFAGASSGNQWRANSRQIQVGMSEKEVRKIMGAPSFTKNHPDGSYEFIYEKSEWKGRLRGGTAVRRMEIVFTAQGKVFSIGKNKDCERTGW